ncbi:hypothetical protein EYZ11_000846 [Aspergillus tanneri]|uniref:Uncharacterized protein n=1 Tax=Aspergillus tanneri TaxID=1220188 RepID=A0A4S3JW65_9EURO|nr:uncharacterized protein ATNIH1004_003154 [Aspergillus tanneri]KAA8650468.1 hypothetical protein ATNIH1004_003154 [Aspergillus tanneri]THC99685.1 hypothetical protein EYZ11_000846 [Aspergillus tanneri]
MKLLSLLSVLPLVSAELLLDFNASRGDNPSKIGTLNLEAKRGQRPKGNTDELYVKLGQDSHGTPALHYHREKGYIRAEYHALHGKTKADQTYYIKYDFALAELQQSLMIWQFKEYKANNGHDGGANIPLSLEVKEGQLNFRYQADAKTGRVSQWSVKPELEERHQIMMAINTAEKGWVELIYDGKKQKFNNGETRLQATTFPGRAEPKFGAYRGEEVVIDTWVYGIQIGTEAGDIGFQE